MTGLWSGYGARAGRADPYTNDGSLSCVGPNPTGREPACCRRPRGATPRLVFGRDQPRHRPGAARSAIERRLTPCLPHLGQVEACIALRRRPDAPVIGGFALAARRVGLADGHCSAAKPASRAAPLVPSGTARSTAVLTRGEPSLPRPHNCHTARNGSGEGSGGTGIGCGGSSIGTGSSGSGTTGGSPGGTGGSDRMWTTGLN
jgi:hypothetical protein